MTLVLRRGWWKPWNWSTRTWLFAIVIGTVFWPFVCRWICLWQVPDVQLPFDINEVTAKEVPEEQNALVGYQRVLPKLNKLRDLRMGRTFEHVHDDKIEIWDERVDKFLDDHGEYLEELRLVSEIEKLQVVPISEINVSSSHPLLEEFRILAPILEAKAISDQRSEKHQAAWSRHRVILRMARHAEMQGHIISRLIAISLRSNAFRGIFRWSSSPKLTANEIRTARTDFDSLLANRFPLAEAAKGECLLIKNSVQLPDYPNCLYPKWDTRGPFESALLPVKRAIFWVAGQPELSLRLTRQLLVNNLNQLDLPTSRRKVLYNKNFVIVFNLEDEIRRRPGQLTPNQLVGQLESAFNRSYLSSDLRLPMSGVLGSCQRETATMEAIRILLAAHEYQRIHAEFPASLKQLVPEFLDDVPIDPLSDSGSAMNYRRDAIDRAIVWSVGSDGKDDGGEIDSISSSTSAMDVGFRIGLSQSERNVETKTGVKSE